MKSHSFSCCRFLCRWRRRMATSPRRAACCTHSTVLVAPTCGFPLWLLLLLLLLLAVVGPVPSSALTTDGVMLLAFKYAVLSDPLSVLVSWNYNDNTPCAWNGVACAGISVPGDGSGGGNDTSRVVSLILPNAQLLGSVPPDLGLMPHLRHLDLSGNSLNGTLPSTLFFPNASASAAAAAPSELRVLSLASNEISGQLPDLPAGAMTNLQVLNLSDNALTGGIPRGLSILPNLTVLSLSGNYLSGPLPVPDGGGFTRAEFVDLSSNLLNGTLPPDFAVGDMIRYLNLSYNRLGGEIPAGFAAKFPRSAVVDLSFNNLTGTIPDSVPLVDQKPRAFAGNPDLCGRPLKILCPIPSTRSEPPHNTTSAKPQTPAAGANSPPAFAAIPKTVDGSSPGSGGSHQENGQRGLKPAAIVGIIAGDLGGIGLLFLVFLYVYQAKKKKRLEEQQEHQLQQQQASRGIGIGKGSNLGVSKQQQQHLTSTPSTMSTPATTAQNGGGGGVLSSMCLGRKAAAASDESEETSTASDTEANDAGKAEEDVKLKKQSENPPQQSGVLVTLDGETELELETLLKASAYILGATCSGIVYKAVLADGTALAVRRIGESSGPADRFRDFEAQVRGIAKLRHPNLLGIRGFYWGADEKLLIYDYAPNGSLANISYKKLASSPYHLTWESRLRIARGTARGLAYLHEKKYVHGNVKPSNILLGPDMDAMIGDFGLERLTSGGGSGKPSFSARHFGSKRSTLSQNSLEASAAAAVVNASPCAGGGASSSASPYHAPESLKNLKPSPKWDVYSFGVVLLEMLTGRVFSESELCQWNAGFPAEERNRLLRMADPAIRSEGEDKEEALLSCFRLGFSCASVAPQRRPTMKEASQVLDRMPSLPFSPLLPA